MSEGSNDASTLGYKYYASPTFSNEYARRTTWQMLSDEGTFGRQQHREWVAYCKGVETQLGAAYDALQNLSI